MNNPCWSASNFANPVGDYGTIQRNSFRGPGYFDTDFGVEKGFGIPKWEGAQFSVGARFFNFFNHPNFGFPVTNISSPQFGEILAPAVSTPTTIYGSGLGVQTLRRESFNSRRSSSSRGFEPVLPKGGLLSGRPLFFESNVAPAFHFQYQKYGIWYNC